MTAEIRESRISKVSFFVQVVIGPVVSRLGIFGVWSRP